MVGKTISHYKIGEGGMGEVYKAEDTRLKRTVALKFLLPHALGGEEEKARFIREAQAAAALDHPNICTIYEIAEDQGRTFIAMAYLEGRDLGKKVADGPLKIGDALDIAIQIAQGLEAAHAKGVVHRDIKPTNLMITGDGTPQQLVKIMDFGLAQLAGHSRLTRDRTTLGTTAYMSPQQTQGSDVDRRADLWALGVVIHEMVSGQLPFKGDYHQAVMYSILNEQPQPLTGLRTGVPMDLERIVGKALEKDVEDRYERAGDMLVDLRSLRKKLASGKSTILSSAGTGTAATPATGAEAGRRPALPQAVVPAPQGPAEDAGLSSAPPAVSAMAEPAGTHGRLRLQRTVLAGALVVALGIIFAMLVRSPEGPPELPLRKFSFPEIADYLAPAISPNDRHIAYEVSRGGDWRRLQILDLASGETRAIEGAEEAEAPFWSPDSNFVGFVSGNELKKVSVQGGPATTLCSLPGPFWGASWSSDGRSIVFGASGESGLYEVPAQGGAVKRLLEAEAEPGFRNPHLLPSESGGRVVLLDNGLARETGEIVLHDLDSGRREVLAPGTWPVYSPTGHIVYEVMTVARNSGTLWALPFSLETLTTTGEPFPVAENAQIPSVARDGTLVYVQTSGVGREQLVWKDRKGLKAGVIGQAQDLMIAPNLSPDGKRVAVWGIENNNSDIWIHDDARGLKTRLTFHPAREDRPIWSPKGDEIAFASLRNGTADVFTKAADGSGEPQPVVATPAAEFVIDWSRDGKYLALVRMDPSPDIWYVERKDDKTWGAPAPFVESPFDDREPTFSPDGRWLAYVTDESGRYEVYVQRFPEGGGKRQVSANGGIQPWWRGDGKELFYVEGKPWWPSP